MVLCGKSRGIIKKKNLFISKLKLGLPIMIPDLVYEFQMIC